jgi:hypothetical protein
MTAVCCFITLSYNGFCKLCLRLPAALLCWFSLSFTTYFGLHDHLKIKLHADGNITCKTHWKVQCSRMLKYSVCYIILNVRNTESLMQFAVRYVASNIAMMRRTLFCRRCNFNTLVSASVSKAGQGNVITIVMSAFWNFSLMLALNRSVSIGSMFQ